MGKTADYTRKAIDDYRNKFDFINLKFPKGTKDKIKGLGISNNDLVEECLNFIAGVEESANDLYYNCSTRQTIIQDAQSDDISHVTGRVGESIDNGITSLTEPQNASEAVITDTELNSVPDGRDKWLNVQSVKELQAMLEAKREEEKRRLQEQKQAKADELEQERAENLRVMIDTIENARQAQAEKSNNPENEAEDKDPDAPITEADYKPMVYLDINNNVIEDPQQYLLDLQRQKAEELQEAIRRNEEYRKRMKISF